MESMSAIKTILFHGTDVKAANLIKKNGFSINLYSPKDNYFGQGVYVTDDKETAIYFAKKAMSYKQDVKYSVLSVYVNVKNVYNINNVRELIQFQNKIDALLIAANGSNNIREYLISLGYDSIDAIKVDSVIGMNIFDPKNIKIVQEEII